MALDHLLVEAGHAGSGLRWTFTRLALPLFAACAATVFRGRISPGRWPVLAALVGVEWALNPYLHLGLPGPVTLLVACMLLWSIPWVRSHGAVVGAFGLLQALYQPVSWSGYQLGLVAAWWALGDGVARQAEQWGPALGRGLEAVGRRPALWYAGHLAVLVLLVATGVLPGVPR